MVKVTSIIISSQRCARGTVENQAFPEMGLAHVILAVLTAILSVIVYLQVKSLYEVPPLPRLENTWWGPRDASKEDTEIRPFKLNISDGVSDY